MHTPVHFSAVLELRTRCLPLLADDAVNTLHSHSQHFSRRGKQVVFLRKPISSISNMSDESWRRPSFRHSVVNKMWVCVWFFDRHLLMKTFNLTSNDCIQSTGLNSSRNGQEMESHVFQRAQNKDEYLGFVARLILHIREIGKNNFNGKTSWCFNAFLFYLLSFRSETKYSAKFIWFRGRMGGSIKLIKLFVIRSIKNETKFL